MSGAACPFCFRRDGPCACAALEPAARVEWRRLVELNAGGPVIGRAEPIWSADGPQCDEGCRYYDGKRCELLGARPSRSCEPVVAEMVRLLDKGGQ